MFYKEIEGEIVYVNEVHFPDGTNLDNENREPREGWTWIDEIPTEEN